MREPSLAFAAMDRLEPQPARRILQRPRFQLRGLTVFVPEGAQGVATQKEPMSMVTKNTPPAVATAGVAAASPGHPGTDQSAVVSGDGRQPGAGPGVHVDGDRENDGPTASQGEGLRRADAPSAAGPLIAVPASGETPADYYLPLKDDAEQNAELIRRLARRAGVRVLVLTGDADDDREALTAKLYELVREMAADDPDEVDRWRSLHLDALDEMLAGRPRDVDDDAATVGRYLDLGLPWD